jgi:hypothetical protein
MKWFDMSEAEMINVATELATLILADIHTPHEPHKSTTATPDGYVVTFESDQLKTTMQVSNGAAEDFSDGAQDFLAFKAIGFGRRYIEAIKATLRRGPK